VSYENRLEDGLMRSDAWSLVSSQRPAGQIAQRTLGGLQQLVYMEDLANIAVLDTLLRQKDRTGNIHAIPYYYYTQPDGSLGRTKVKKVKKKNREKFIAEKGAVEILKVVVLKDNDCSVGRSENDSRALKMVEKIRHIHPQTYRMAVRFVKDLETAPFRSFFREELRFTEQDYLRMMDDARYISEALQSNCRAGMLHLDADPDAFLRGEEIRDSYNYCE